MVTIEKLLQCATTKKYQIKDVPADVIANLTELARLLSNIEIDYGKELKFECSYRDKWHNAKVGGAENSSHLYGLTVDIQDLKNELFKWFIANKEEKANKYNVFLEDIIKKDGSKRNWLHATKRPFPSYKEGGTRVFKP